jgi:3-hydroxyacyl-[acyl-carrier-protein] dehydratase
VPAYASATAPVIELVSSDGDVHVAAVTIDPRDPVFAGHYPGFPVYPGAYMMAVVDHTVRASTGLDLEMSAMRQAKFRSPVYPGDRVTVEVTVRPGDAEWAVSAVVTGPSGVATDMRLTYREGTP